MGIFVCRDENKMLLPKQHLKKESGQYGNDDFEQYGGGIDIERNE